jgi:hypothetical protein
MKQNFLILIVIFSFVVTTWGADTAVAGGKTFNNLFLLKHILGFLFTLEFVI